MLINSLLPLEKKLNNYGISMLDSSHLAFRIR